ncbi:putative thrombospondin type 1 domain-containing protein [Cryptosporidium felis]|nr:putative thrombospondin type 1 domain-containing protein [Cryptosporidium felis]
MMVFSPKDKDCSKEKEYLEAQECEAGCETATLDICQVTEWGQWSSCSANCDGGSRRRIRERVNSGRGAAKGGSRPLTRGVSSSCPSLLEVEKCNTHPCEFSCELSAWYTKSRNWKPPDTRITAGEEREEFTGLAREESLVSECSARCGVGVVERTRRVLSGGAAVPGPALGGFAESRAGEHGQASPKTCGPLRESLRCLRVSGGCTIDCQVGEWGPWSSCSASCGEGFQNRSRELLVPSLGRRCELATEELRECFLGACPSSCQVSAWSEWSDCLGGCDEKPFRRRERKILEAPAPGQTCPVLEETVDAEGDCPRREKCPLDCVVSNWSTWSQCDVKCGIGVEKRVRKILRRESKGGGGAPCPNLEDLRPCSRDACRSDCVLGEWGDWEACSKSCGGGSRSRTRAVISQPNDGLDCDHLKDFEPCNEFQCIATRDCEVGQWCPGEPCIDRPEAQEVVPCSILKAMFGCQKRLVEVAKSNGVPYPEDRPPEARIMDGCPMTCGMCSECAPGCQLRDVGNLSCDPACNNSACRFDDGDCELNSSQKASCILPKLSDAFLVLVGRTGTGAEGPSEAGNQQVSEPERRKVFKDSSNNDVVVLESLGPAPGASGPSWSELDSLLEPGAGAASDTPEERKEVGAGPLGQKALARSSGSEQLEYLPSSHARDWRHSYTYIMNRDMGEPIFITGDHQRIILGPVGTLYLISIDSFYPEFQDPDFERYRLWSLVDISQQKIIQEFVELRLVCVKDPNSINSNISSSGGSNSDSGTVVYRRPLRFLSEALHGRHGEEKVLRGPAGGQGAGHSLRDFVGHVRGQHSQSAELRTS